MKDHFKVVPFLFSYLSVKITIHARLVFLDMVSLDTNLTAVCIGDNPTGPATFHEIPAFFFFIL
jgi:hypothetical protein